MQRQNENQIKGPIESDKNKQFTFTNDIWTLFSVITPGFKYQSNMLRLARSDFINVISTNVYIKKGLKAPQRAYIIGGNI